MAARLARTRIMVQGVEAMRPIFRNWVSGTSSKKNSQALDKVSSLLGFEAFVGFISESLKPFFEYSLDDGQL